MKTYAHRYQVRRIAGRAGAFPIDMLRYDRSTPATEEDSGLIEDPKDWKAITLSNRGSAVREWHPAARRWESFGWEVVSGSQETSQIL